VNSGRFRLRWRPGPRFWVLAISGILGFRIGLIGFPTWHIAIETAQVVAGLVRYPVDNPFYIYHTTLWSLLIQLCAVLLRAGISEITLSLALSGLLGMISFQGLAIVTYAIGRDALVAIAAAVVVFVSGVTDYGPIYPVWLLGTHHSYGAIGLSTFVLALGLIGVGCYRSGAFLLGLGPAVHPSIGIWVGAVAMVAFSLDYRTVRERLQPARWYFAAGCAVTLLSAAVQFALIYDVPAVDETAVNQAFATFVRFWDAHRRVAITFDDVGVIFNRIALAVCVVWLIGFAGGLPWSALFLIRIAAIAGSVSIGFVMLTWLPAESVPRSLSILMPARLLNLDVVLVAPLVLGLAASFRDRLIPRALLVLLLGGLLLAPKSLLWRWFIETARPAWTIRVDPTLLLEAGAFAVVCLALWQHMRPRASAPAAITPGATAPRLITPGAPASRSLEARSAAAVRWLLRGATVVLLVIGTALAWRISAPRTAFRDRTNDPFYAEVAADRRGLTVAAGSFQLVQLYTRRPVLIDSGALDIMVYAPEGAPAAARIVTDVYGVDFFDPPREIRGSAMIPHDTNKYTWSRFSTQRWRELRRTYNVSQIVARADYELALPIVAEADGLRLYRIPD
jgi:hypothetical protein